MAMAQPPMEMEVFPPFDSNLRTYNEYGEAIDKFLQLPAADVMSDIEMQDVEGLHEELFKPTSDLLTNCNQVMELHEKRVCEHLADDNGRVIGAIVSIEGDMKRKVHPRLFLQSDNNPRLTDFNMPLELKLQLSFMATDDDMLPRQNGNNEIHQNEDDGFQHNWEFDVAQSFEANIWHEINREIARNLVAMGILEDWDSRADPTGNNGVAIETVEPPIAINFEEIVVPEKKGRKKPRKVRDVPRIN